MTDELVVSLSGLEDAHKPRQCQTQKLRVVLDILAPDDATIEEVRDFMYDLEWSGGCRDPDHDPMFESVYVAECVVRKRRR